MKVNQILHDQILEIVNSQLQNNDPRETQRTLKRLMESGYSESDSKKLIGQCVIVELFDIIKHQKPFDEERYVANLKRLPEEPSDDEEDDF